MDNETNISSEEQSSRLQQPAVGGSTFSFGGKCAVCGATAKRLYGYERSCGAVACEVEIQAYIDYRIEREW